MTKLQLSLVGAVVIAGALASVVIWHQTRARLRERDKVLWQQDNQLAELTAEHQRLSNLVVRAQNSPTNGRLAELQKLRSEVEDLRKRAEQLQMEPAVNLQPKPSRAASSAEPHPPEYWQKLHQMAGGRTKDAVILSMVFIKYGSDHQGQFPLNFDQVVSYLRKEPSLTGTNDFEIVYRGSFEDLKRVPSGAVALIRDQQAWLAPSGKWAKIYGMANGTAEIVESDDNFQSWEAEHIIPSPAGQ